MKEQQQPVTLEQLRTSRTRLSKIVGETNSYNAQFAPAREEAQKVKPPIDNVTETNRYTKIISRAAQAEKRMNRVSAKLQGLEQEINIREEEELVVNIGEYLKFRRSLNQLRTRRDFVPSGVIAKHEHEFKELTEKIGAENIPRGIELYKAREVQKRQEEKARRESEAQPIEVPTHEPVEEIVATRVAPQIEVEEVAAQTVEVPVVTPVTQEAPSAPGESPAEAPKQKEKNPFELEEVESEMLGVLITIRNGTLIKVGNTGRSFIFDVPGEISAACAALSEKFHQREVEAGAVTREFSKLVRVDMIEKVKTILALEDGALEEAIDLQSDELRTILMWLHFENLGNFNGKIGKFLSDTQTNIVVVQEDRKTSLVIDAHKEWVLPGNGTDNGRVTTVDRQQKEGRISQDIEEYPGINDKIIAYLEEMDRRKIVAPLLSTVVRTIFPRLSGGNNRHTDMEILDQKGYIYPIPEGHTTQTAHPRYDVENIVFTLLWHDLRHKFPFTQNSAEVAHTLIKSQMAQREEEKRKAAEEAQKNNGKQNGRNGNASK